MSLRHSKKAVREALEEAEKKGFVIQKASGHAWGILISSCEVDTCMNTPYGHRMSISSTPKSETNEAKKIRRFVQRCENAKKK